jgi:hypothetical protein
MGTIYIGGHKSRKQGGFKWKLYMFLFLFLAITGTVLKVTAPTIVEQWINRNGAGKNGYAYSIREVDLSLGKGEIRLRDVKIFNPKTNSEIIETPELVIKVDLQDLVLSQDKKVSLNAEKVDLILSKDFSSEIERIKVAGKDNKNFYLDSVEGKIGNLNIIEKKDDQSRTMLELNNVSLKVKEVSPLSINKKTEFSVSSNVAEGGTLSLSGKTNEENGKTPWSIHGVLKQVSSDIFNKIAGDKLPFSFFSSNLNAEISAHSDHGKVKGEIVPDIDRVNLLEERAGYQAQPIKRLLNEELTFSLPFTIKDEVTLQYEDIFSRLKNYRRGASVSVATESAQAPAPVSKVVKAKKASSWWPF